MKLSQVAPVWWCRRYNRWAMNLSPWRYAALMATGAPAGLALGHWLAGADPLTERFLLFGTSWLMCFLVGRLIAPAALQTLRQREQWRKERHQTEQDGKSVAAGSSAPEQVHQ